MAAKHCDHGGVSTEMVERLKEREQNLSRRLYEQFVVRQNVFALGSPIPALLFRTKSHGSVGIESARPGRMHTSRRNPNHAARESPRHSAFSSSSYKSNNNTTVSTTSANGGGNQFSLSDNLLPKPQPLTITHSLPPQLLSEQSLSTAPALQQINDSYGPNVTTAGQRSSIPLLISSIASQPKPEAQALIRPSYTTHYEALPSSVSYSSTTNMGQHGLHLPGSGNNSERENPIAPVAKPYYLAEQAIYTPPLLHPNVRSGAEVAQQQPTTSTSGALELVKFADGAGLKHAPTIHNINSNCQRSESSPKSPLVKAHRTRKHGYYAARPKLSMATKYAECPYCHKLCQPGRNNFQKHLQAHAKNDGELEAAIIAVVQKWIGQNSTGEA